MKVHVVGWDHNRATAKVEGANVGVRRNKRAVVWTCNRCGAQINRPQCPHALALAAAEPRPEDRWGAQRQGDRQ